MISIEEVGLEPVFAVPVGQAKIVLAGVICRKAAWTGEDRWGWPQPRVGRNLGRPSRGVAPMDEEDGTKSGEQGTRAIPQRPRRGSLNEQVHMRSES